MGNLQGLWGNHVMSLAQHFPLKKNDQKNVAQRRFRHACQEIEAG